MSDTHIEPKPTLNQEESIISNIIGDETPPAKVGDNLPFDIDTLFGNSGDAVIDNIEKPAGGPTIPSASEQKPKMSQEEYLRELQSRVDKSTNTIKTLEERNADLTSATDFINQLYENQDVFKAFVHEIDPSLIKPPTPEDYISANLSKEFGSDFVPDQSEENIRGSRTWLYNKRADDLYAEAVTRSTKTPQSLKDMRASRLAEQDEFQRMAIKEKDDILTAFSWSQGDYDGFLQWADKVKTMDIARLYNHGKSKFTRQAVPSLAGVPGGTPPSDSAYVKELNNFFG